jgi:hypothetical protein
VLRIGVVVHNTQEVQCGRSLEKPRQIAVQVKDILERFIDALSCIDQSFIADSMLEQLPAPSCVGKTKSVESISTSRACVGQSRQSLLCVYRYQPLDLRLRNWPVRSGLLSNHGESLYGARCAACDLKKLRGKNIVRRIGETRRYQSISSGLKAMVALLVLRTKAINPLLAAAQESARIMRRRIPVPSTGTTTPFERPCKPSSGAEAGCLNFDNDFFKIHL